MTPEEKTSQLNTYSVRYHFWKDKVLTPLGYSIHLFFTIGYFWGIAATSRLFDLRYTSHIIKVRQTALKYYNVILKPIKHTSYKKQMQWYCRVMFGKPIFVTKADYKNTAVLLLKFNTLRTLTNRLGRLTCTVHKINCNDVNYSYRMYNLGVIPFTDKNFALEYSFIKHYGFKCEISSEKMLNFYYI